MLSIKFFLRRYKVDIRAALFAVLLYILGFFLTQDAKLLLIWSLVVTFLSLGVIIYTRVKEKDFYFISLGNRKHREDWMGIGTFDYVRSEHCFRITNSDPGYIYSKTLTWNDYKLEFQFKILKKSVGVVVRAVNLSNLVMLQIFTHGVKPHIRVNGFYKWWEPEEAGLTFDKTLSLDKWYKGVFYVDKTSISIRIFDGSRLVCDRSWNIPQQGQMLYPAKRPELTDLEYNIPFSINLEYGTFGFRNWGDEEALVKNILVEKSGV